ncbi:alpha/beta hydrolase [Staphylococcus lutrae]|uniref:Lipase n=1 Tax=Staphylococcus lutrae TaxID=155085 RepID=A0AAC9RP13_9STAP|nr:alpha/beta hydrolase [Staphylococcus lutrae]ARJ51203.1 lipase [Staphylococcus lutrae]PNZ39448.1 alpha/beta hydrolase [Staphylococcus lutrae]
MTNHRKRWILITFIILLVIAGLIAGYFFEPKQSKHVDQKVSIQNKNVSAIENITYMEGLPNSQLDILMPKHVNANEKLPVIFWVHGGGFIAGDKQYKNPLLAQIAEHGYVVVNINYALAPEYRYPTPLIQMDHAVRFIKQNERNLPINLNEVVIGGDSAGAQISSQYTAMQTNTPLRKEMDFAQQFSPNQIKAAMFFGGFYDMKTVRATEFPRIDLFMKSYTGVENWETRFKNITEMSTKNQLTAQFPATYLSVGDADPFMSQNVAFANALEKKDIVVERFFFDGTHHLKHQYQFHLNKPESKENIQQMLHFLSRNTSNTQVNTKTSEGAHTEIVLNPYDI